MSRFDQPPPVLPEEFRARLLSPAMVILLDRVRANIARVIEACGGDVDRWRPHVKTSKLPAVMGALVDAGVRSFKCATTREAAVLLEVLDERGAAADVLMAQPLREPHLDRLALLAERHPSATVSVLSEDPAHAVEVPPMLDVFVDVDPGMNRTGVAPDRRETIIDVARAAAERFRGVHFYEGHLADHAFADRRRAAFATYDRLMEVIETLSGASINVGEIITSGTPTFPCALAYEPFGAADAPLHRVSPGTAVLHDVRCEQRHPGAGFEPAAVVFSRIVSCPTSRIATCDAGSKSIVSESAEPCCEVLGRPELRPRVPSEEHLPLEVIDGESPERGEGIWLVPHHVCPCVNLAEKVVLVDGQRVEIVAVAARGHELETLTTERV